MFCICDNIDTQIGFRLAGISGEVAHTNTELKDSLDRALADHDIGILLINEKLSRRFPDMIKEIRLNRHLPLIVEIPDRHGSGRSSDFITAYIREAIGLKL